MMVSVIYHLMSSDNHSTYKALCLSTIGSCNSACASLGHTLTVASSQCSMNSARLSIVCVISGIESRVSACLRLTTRSSWWTDLMGADSESVCVCVNVDCILTLAPSNRRQMLRWRVPWLVYCRPVLEPSRSEGQVKETPWAAQHWDDVGTPSNHPWRHGLQWTTPIAAGRRNMVVRDELRYSNAIYSLP